MDCSSVVCPIPPTPGKVTGQPEVRREAGVGFATKSALVAKLVGPPKGINDRLISVRIPLSHGRETYTPTLTNPDEAKDKFYEDECPHHRFSHQ